MEFLTDSTTDNEVIWRQHELDVIENFVELFSPYFVGQLFGFSSIPQAQTSQTQVQTSALRDLQRLHH